MRVIVLWHLFIIIPGYIGHFIDENILIHIIKWNVNGLFCWTFNNINDGISRSSQRVCNEIKRILNNNPTINKLSIIGCSLGGIYARYCLSILFDANNHNENDIESTTLSINGKPIQLMNYISLASPHCGLADKSQRYILIIDHN